MKNYVKPVVLGNEEVFEGVYAASGDCYTVSAEIKQKPEEGRGNYVIQVNATHEAKDGHHSGEQVLTVSFNQPVTWVWSEGKVVGGDNTSSLSIQYNYHNNMGPEYIGLGNLTVESEGGLAIIGVVLTCNYDCGQDDAHINT